VRIHYLQHVSFEGPAAIGDWASARGHAQSATRLDEGARLPDPSSLDWLVVMGGPMGVGDEDRFPWLSAEKRFIERTLSAGKTVLGICLGAQLLADVLGARVYPNRHREIGWFPVETTEAARATDLFGFLPPRDMAFHWPGDTFDQPRGAFRMARSAASENQAFVWDASAVALQFHFEATDESVRALIANCGHEIVAGDYIQSREEMLGDGSRSRSANEAMRGLLDRMESHACPGSP
jgi:GMP synthase (glutamine-hydrolysing)